MDAKWTRDGFTILDKEHHSTIDHYKEHYSPSDLTFITKDGTSYPAHRSFMAAKSHYFSALLYGGLQESGENEVNLLCSDQVLKPILNFLYSGKIDLQGSSVDVLVDLLDTARLMCINNLCDAVENLIIEEYIRNPLVCFDTIKNVINILNVAMENSSEELIKCSRAYLEEYIDDVLTSIDHLQSLSAPSLKLLLSGNDLDVPEIEIFKGVMDWVNSKEISPKDKSSVLSEVRLDQMTTKQIVRDVCPSGLFSEIDMFRAIASQETIIKKENTRKVILNENICLSTLGAKVIKAVKSEQSDVDVVINGQSNAKDYDQKKGYAMSRIGEGLEVELSTKQKINKIKILLHNKDEIISRKAKVQKSYSYRMETSLDGITWEVITDFSNYKCSSWQTVYFEDRRVKYIRIVGTRYRATEIYRYTVWDGIDSEQEENSDSDEDDFVSEGSTPPNHIHVVAIETMLDTNTREQDRKNSGMEPII